MKKDTTILILITLVLLLAGALMIFSIGALQDPRATVFLKHLLYLGVGIICFLRLMYFDYRKLGTPRMLRLIVVAAIFLLILTFIPFGSTINGASRWIGGGSSVSSLPEFPIRHGAAARKMSSTRQDQQFRLDSSYLSSSRAFRGHCSGQRDVSIPFVMLAATLPWSGWPATTITAQQRRVLRGGAAAVLDVLSDGPHLGIVRPVGIPGNRRVPSHQSSTGSGRPVGTRPRRRRTKLDCCPPPRFIFTPG